MNLRKYVRRLILEQIEWGAFHGYLMNPAIMGRDPRFDSCDMTWTSPEDETGCPQFDGDGNVTTKEIETAYAYLNDIKPKSLIVYSRGAAILGHVLEIDDVYVPETVIFIAAAWKRWGSVDKRVFNKIQKKIFYHGQIDPFVPLKHTFELAQGEPVGILLGGDHYAGKDYVSGEMPELVPIGKKLLQQYPDIFGADGKSKGTLRHISWMQQKPDVTISHSGEGLPDWGLSGLANFEEVVQQLEWVRNITNEPSKRADGSIVEWKKYSLLQIL